MKKIVHNQNGTQPTTPPPKKKKVEQHNGGDSLTAIIFVRLTCSYLLKPSSANFFHRQVNSTTYFVQSSGSFGCGTWAHF